MGSENLGNQPQFTEPLQGGVATWGLLCCVWTSIQRQKRGLLPDTLEPPVVLILCGTAVVLTPAYPRVGLRVSTGTPPHLTLVWMGECLFMGQLPV